MCNIFTKSTLYTVDKMRLSQEMRLTQVVVNKTAVQVKCTTRAQFSAVVMSVKYVVVEFFVCC